MTSDDQTTIGEGGVPMDDGGMAGNGDWITGGVGPVAGGSGGPISNILLVDLTEEEEGNCQEGSDGGCCPGEGHQQSQSEEVRQVSRVKSAIGERIIDDTVRKLVKGFQQENGETLEENRRLKEANRGLEAMLDKACLELATEMAKVRALEDQCKTLNGVISAVISAVRLLGTSSISFTPGVCENVSACGEVPVTPQQEVTSQTTQTVACLPESDIVEDVGEQLELCTVSRSVVPEELITANPSIVLAQHESHQQLDTLNEEEVVEEEAIEEEVVEEEVLQGASDCEVSDPVTEQNCMPTDTPEVFDVVYVDDNGEQQLESNHRINLVAAAGVDNVAVMADDGDQQMDSNCGHFPSPPSSSQGDTLLDELLSRPVTGVLTFSSYRNGPKARTSNGGGPYLSSLNAGGFHSRGPYRRRELQHERAIEHGLIGTPPGAGNICACGKMFKDGRALMSHIRYYSKFRCGRCEKHYHSEDNVELRMMQDHCIQGSS